MAAIIASGLANSTPPGDVRRGACGQAAAGLGLSPDGKRLYVANGPSNDVSVIDLATAKELGQVKAGAGPWGVAIVPR